MDLLPDLDLMSPVVQAEVTIQRQAHNANQAALLAANDQHVVEPWTDEMFISKHIVISFHSRRT